jgi:hypothetical protein
MSRHSVTSSPSHTPHTPHTPLLAQTLWLHSRLLTLHPAAFRRDYGDSIQQVFRQTCLDAARSGGTAGILRLWLPALGDLLAGALAEHAALLSDILKGSSAMLQIRRSASIIFAAFIAFVIAGIGFQKENEDIMKTALPGAHPILAISYDVMLVGALVALAAILVGGLPVAVAALRYALANRRFDIVARFLVPPVALLVVIAGFFVVTAFNIGGATVATIHTPARIAAIGGLIVLFVLAAVASAYAVLSAIARSDINERLLRFTLLPGALATIAMLAMVAALAGWSVGLWQNAPAHFFGNDGVLSTSTLVGIVAQAIIMVVATILAINALAHGLAARRAAPALA